MLYQIQDTCPKCHKPIRLETITPHPTLARNELHSFHCSTCGPVKTKVIPIQPIGEAA
jgi:hypothetical protein